MSKAETIVKAIEGAEKAYELLDELGIVDRAWAWIKTRPPVWRARRARRRARRARRRAGRK